MHAGRKNTIASCLSARLDYAKNPEKTEEGLLVRTFECDAKTVDTEFLLSKKRYLQITGRKQKSDVIAYQFRQSFKPGEVSPEEANAIGYEFAERFLKGQHAFLVATHIDKAHIHNHIIWNSTTLDCSRKFRDFWYSGIAASRLSDIICMEHHLSVINNPNRIRHTKNPYSKKDEGLSKREDRISYLVDIEKKLREGKGAGFEQWAKKFNLKQMAKSLNYLTEHDLLDYEKLEKRSAEVKGIFDSLTDEIKEAEAKMKEISELRTQIINYVKTREIYAAYRKSGYSKKFLEEHEGEIILHKAAKKKFDELGLKKLPKVKELNAGFQELLKKKRAAYSKYKEARDEMKEVLIAKSNIDQILQKEGIIKNERSKKAL